MEDETEALSTLMELGRKALDEACARTGSANDSYESHDTFREALADYSDDLLWRLFERAHAPVNLIPENDDEYRDTFGGPPRQDHQRHRGT
jgi:hypothetical protein